MKKDVDSSCSTKVGVAVGAVIISFSSVVLAMIITTSVCHHIINKRYDTQSYSDVTASLTPRPLLHGFSLCILLLCPPPRSSCATSTKKLLGVGGGAGRGAGGGECDIVMALYHG